EARRRRAGCARAARPAGRRGANAPRREARTQRHADSGSHGAVPPEPCFAERARTLLHVGRVGSLGTLSLRQPGHPFVSLAPYGLDATGSPTLLLSSMAMHTQHVAADPRASLLVSEPAAPAGAP